MYLPRSISTFTFQSISLYHFRSILSLYIHLYLYMPPLPHPPPHLVKCFSLPIHLSPSLLSYTCKSLHLYVSSTMSPFISIYSLLSLHPSLSISIYIPHWEDHISFSLTLLPISLLAYLFLPPSLHLSPLFFSPTLYLSPYSHLFVYIYIFMFDVSLYRGIEICKDEREMDEHGDEYVPL